MGVGRRPGCLPHFAFVHPRPSVFDGPKAANTGLRATPGDARVIVKIQSGQTLQFWWPSSRNYTNAWVVVAGPSSYNRSTVKRARLKIQ